MQAKFIDYLFEKTLQRTFQDYFFFASTLSPNFYEIGFIKDLARISLIKRVGSDHKLN